MSSNLKYLSHAQEAELVRAILNETHFIKGHSYVRMPETLAVFERHGVSPSIEISLTPVIRILKCIEIERQLWIDTSIDLRDHTDGRPGCLHVPVQLYWEVGGGGMDSGKPHRYRFCIKCGYHKLSAWETLERMFKPKRFEVSTV